MRKNEAAQPKTKNCMELKANPKTQFLIHREKETPKQKNLNEVIL